MCVNGVVLVKVLKQLYLSLSIQHSTWFSFCVKITILICCWLLFAAVFQGTQWTELLYIKAFLFTDFHEHEVRVVLYQGALHWGLTKSTVYSLFAYLNALGILVRKIHNS